MFDSYKNIKNHFPKGEKIPENFIAQLAKQDRHDISLILEGTMTCDR
jgi:hypothetical protein